MVVTLSLNKEEYSGKEEERGKKKKHPVGLETGKISDIIRDFYCPASMVAPI